MDPESRRERALRGLSSLGPRSSDHRVVNVQCSHSHHLAAVYETPQGLVYRAVEGRRAHGSRDRDDASHHGAHHGVEYVDLLISDPGDDALPASCECGPHTLSRAQLMEAIQSRQGTLHVA